MKTFIKAFGFALLLTLPVSLALAASGDVNYVKRSAQVKLNASQISGLVGFIGQIAPGLTASSAVSVTCQKMPSNAVVCWAMANATASPAAYVADQVAGLVASTTSVVP